MLFVQVILGGLSVVLNVPVDYHIVWGIVTFIVLVAGTVFIAREHGRSSAIFKIALAAIADYVVQGILGFFSLSSNPAIVIHLTNAFVLAVLATYLISNADRAEAVKVPTQSSVLPAGSPAKNTSQIK
jgi:heme A synthase